MAIAVIAFKFMRMIVRATLAVLFAVAAPLQTSAQDAPIVAAASDLKFALEEVAGKFRADSGREVKLVFGSSGNFTAQISQGAPFQMFLSADEDFISRLADQGKTVDRGALYAVGRIVLFAPKGSSLKVDEKLVDLRAALADGRIRRFAIANPDHAPYGRAAEQALRAQGLWDAVQSRLVLGENVSQAAQFAASGSAEGGIFAYSLALSPSIGGLGEFALLPDSWHQPLRQRMALLKGAGETARAFYAYVQTPPSRAVFRRFGFLLPGEGL